MRDHVYERYLPPPNDGLIPLVDDVLEDAESGLEHLDPVCLMDVDPATTRYKLDYKGRTVYFCAAACKKAFEHDPEAYLPG